MSQDLWTAQRAVENAVANDPHLLKKIRADHEARERAKGNGGAAVATAEPVQENRELPSAIRNAMLSDLPSFDKRRAVAQLVQAELKSLGRFCRTQDGRAFFFLKSNRRLYDLEQKPFQHLLTRFSGLSLTETSFRFVLDVLQAETATGAPLVEVHTLAHYDSETRLLVISDGGGGIWLRERGGEWSFTGNGEHSLLFMTEPEATAWTPEFGGNGETLRWFLSRAMLASEPLTRDQQQTLLYVNLLHQFFPCLRRTRMVPAFLGPQGSGKTTALRLFGCLFLGPHFDVTGLHREKEDAFVAAVTNRTICGLDNADSRIPWLEDALATYATGLRYRLRRLYSTNEEVSYGPRAMLMLSSRDPQFNRPDVAERLLPVYFERPEKYQAEAEIFRELDVRRGAIWGELLTRMGEIADGLPQVGAPALPFRMADFASFGWRVFAMRGQQAQWEALLAKLEATQMGFASDGDGVIEALRVLLEQRGGSIQPIRIAELFGDCQKVAEGQGLPFPRTSLGFGKRLSVLRRVIELELRVRLREERDRHRGRWVSLEPRAAEDAEGAEDVSEKVFNSRMAE